ncbi:MAG TPA: hypothetical protein PLX58_04860 [Smithellaceae bacterium]|nr:hypothetical protein [Smithellaceae bacterium]HQF84282.1 hypothetical protein [Smithellaceae bacterium]HQG80551.1 hypothetical protein [Smithellaceae bacterium]
MKRIIISVQILLAVFILVKVASVSGIFEKGDFFTGAASFIRQAQAEPQVTGARAVHTQEMNPPDEMPAPPKDAMKDILAEQRDLAKALASKKAELDERENLLRAEEQRLLALRRDIVEKMNILKAQEEKLAAELDQVREDNIKRFKEMAKVYESTPPAKAGPMMEKLDTKTAAGITMNMKKDKAGALWAFLTPAKAVEITKEITRAGGSKSE